MFAVVYEILRDSTLPLLDVGCGVGLLAFYLRERGLDHPITGIDVDARKIQRALAAGNSSAGALRFMEANVSDALPSFSGNIAVLDLLHYLSPEHQQRLLEQLAARVSAGGTLLLRDCPRDGTPRFWATYVGEIFAQTISWNWKTALHFPTADSIAAAFRGDDFTLEIQQAWGGTPFNNQLFIFRRRASSGAVPATE